MTPKEEAKDLYDTFSTVILFRIDGVVSPLPKGAAQQCGRVCISKILDALYRYEEPKRIDHYLQVRDEFNILCE